jgi:hypothetical protein
MVPYRTKRSDEEIYQQATESVGSRILERISGLSKEGRLNGQTRFMYDELHRLGFHREYEDFPLADESI